MSNNAGPWGPRSGRPAEPAAVPPTARAAAFARPTGAPSVWINLLSTLALAAIIASWAGWRWALAGIFGLFVHEYGHVIAMNLLGCGPAHIRIIPFLGGAAVPARNPSTEFRGVVIALAGPFFGLIATIPFFAAAMILNDTKWLGAAFFVALINLLNLAPAPPLDGSKALGPALAWINPWVEKGAILLIGALAAIWLLTHGSLITGSFIAIATLGALKRGAFRPQARKLTGGEWASSLALYFAVGAAGVFAIGMIFVALGLPADPRSTLTIFGLLR